MLRETGGKQLVQLVPDAFELYPCLVDDAPASIYVNLIFEDGAPDANRDTRYTIAIGLREHGEHGIGTAEEGEAVNEVEEAVIADASQHAITYVGRIRTRGIWEIVLYGPPGHAETLRARATERAAGRRLEVRAVHDASWTYYREILLPDAERRQWIDNRRMVQILGEQGDRLATPRRVDHRLVFPTDAARAAFVSAVEPRGFALDHHAGTDGRIHAHVHRVDAIELDHIHDVVMSLVDIAVAHGGSYERWQAGITS